MSVTKPELYYDPYDFEIDTNPYPLWKRLRDEAPLYYNEKYDFFALSRFDDVEKALVDWRTFSSAKGTVLEQRQVLVVNDAQIGQAALWMPNDLVEQRAEAAHQHADRLRREQLAAVVHDCDQMVVALDHPHHQVVGGGRRFDVDLPQRHPAQAHRARSGILKRE